MKRIFISIFVVSLLSAVAFGQGEEESFERTLWRTRAEILTSSLLKDASKGDALDRAVLLARLSDLWWASDQDQANAWIEKAVDAIYFYPSEEIKAQGEKFFSVSRQILVLISARNKRQSNRLLEILSRTDDVPGKEKDSNADALIELALRVVKESPNNAAELGVRAFNLGYPKKFHELSWELRRYDAALADRFFKTAFSVVTASPDYEKLYTMQLAAVPESIIPNFPLKLRPPVNLKALFLNFLADHLTQQQSKFSAKSLPSCLDEAALVSRLQNYFTELLPQKSALVRHAASICLAGQSPDTQRVMAQTSTPKSSDVDALLKRADEVQNEPLIRASYLFKAALAANHQKNYAKSIQILESMNDDERKADATFWEELRFDSGAGLAMTQFKEENATGAGKTLRDVPDPIRPLAQITFVLKCSPEDAPSHQFCVELLDDARRGILKSELPFARKASYWLNLVKLYSNYKLPGEAAGVFREIAVAFNGSLSDNASSAKDATRDAASNQFTADSGRIIPTLPPALLEAQENSIFESVNLLKQEKPRIQINLAFLEMALKKYQSLNSESEKKSGKRPSPQSPPPGQRED